MSTRFGTVFLTEYIPLFMGIYPTDTLFSSTFPWSKCRQSLYNSSAAAAEILVMQTQGAPAMPARIKRK